MVDLFRLPSRPTSLPFNAAVCGRRIPSIDQTGWVDILDRAGGEGVDGLFGASHSCPPSPECDRGTDLWNVQAICVKVDALDRPAASSHPLPWAGKTHRPRPAPRPAAGASRRYRRVSRSHNRCGLRQCPPARAHLGDERVTGSSSGTTQLPTTSPIGSGQSRSVQPSQGAKATQSGVVRSGIDPTCTERTG